MIHLVTNEHCEFSGEDPRSRVKRNGKERSSVVCGTVRLVQSFRGRNELRHPTKNELKGIARRRFAPGKALLCEDGVAGRYLIQ